MDEAYPTLQRLKSEGVLRAVGIGMNQWQALARFARSGDFDCFLLAGRYTLLDQSALPTLMPLCEEKADQPDPGRSVQQRHTGVRPGAGHDVLLRQGAGRRPGPGAGRQDRLRPAQRSPEGGRAAVRPRAPRGGEHDPRRPIPGGGRGERQDGRARHSGRPVGRSEDGGTHTGRGACANSLTRGGIHEVIRDGPEPEGRRRDDPDLQGVPQGRLAGGAPGAQGHRNIKDEDIPAGTAHVHVLRGRRRIRPDARLPSGISPPNGPRSGKR